MARVMAPLEAIMALIGTVTDVGDLLTTVTRHRFAVAERAGKGDEPARSTAGGLEFFHVDNRNHRFRLARI